MDHAPPGPRCDEAGGQSFQQDWGPWDSVRGKIQKFESLIAMLSGILEEDIQARPV